MEENNRPQQLLTKHLNSLELFEPLYIEDDNDLFQTLASPAKSAVVFLPKSKALIDMTLALVSGKVELGGKIVLAGSNDAGIRSAKDAYEKSIGPVEEKIVGNHSALYVGKNEKRGAGRKFEDFLTFFPVPYMELTEQSEKKEIQVANFPGVFSGGELDEGTRLLLEHIPYDKEKILDVGCGSGVIGAIYKAKNPKAHITMSDSSRLAVRAAQETMRKNGFDAQVVLADVFDGIEGKFDLILCNPPFHKGVDTDYSFIEKFAKDARRHLAPKGKIYIVANAFLPYKEILETNVGKTDIIADDRSFRVYSCEQ